MAQQIVDFFDDRDESDLLADAKAGDLQAADVLWIRVRPAVLATARKVAGNKYDAEDLASEAMTKVFAAIAQGHGPSESVRAYLCTTVRNLHITAVRREQRTGTPLELDEERVLNLVAPEADAIESDIVANAFKNLPARWRYVLWSNLIEGRDGSELAGELGINPTAVHALKSRALEGLRQNYLTEHAKLGTVTECADVHRDLAAIVRGRARKSTNTDQVWGHLRSCEHCAEGYRELSAINNRIGAIIGAPALGLAAFAAKPTSGTLVELFKIPATIGNVAVAAGVAGAIAISVTALPHTTEAITRPGPQTAQAQLPAPGDDPTERVGASSSSTRSGAQGKGGVASPSDAPTPTCSDVALPPASLAAVTDHLGGLLSTFASTSQPALSNCVHDTTRSVSAVPDVGTSSNGSAPDVPDLATVTDAVPDLAVDPLSEKFLPDPQVQVDPADLLGSSDPSLLSEVPVLGSQP